MTASSAPSASGRGGEPSGVAAPPLDDDAIRALMVDWPAAAVARLEGLQREWGEASLAATLRRIVLEVKAREGYRGGRRRTTGATRPVARRR